jgi:hypothetical protein
LALIELLFRRDDVNAKPVLLVLDGDGHAKVLAKPVVLVNKDVLEPPVTKPTESFRQKSGRSLARTVLDARILIGLWREGKLSAEGEASFDRVIYHWVIRSGLPLHRRIPIRGRIYFWH